jgi:hypothetical protein
VVFVILFVVVPIADPANRTSTISFDLEHMLVKINEFDVSA